MVKGEGGAMDLVASADDTVNKLCNILIGRGESKLLSSCLLPLTGVACVKKIVTDLAVIEVSSEKGFVLLEKAPGVSVEEIQEKTAGAFVRWCTIPEISLDCLTDSILVLNSKRRDVHINQTYSGYSFSCRWNWEWKGDKSGIRISDVADSSNMINT